MNNKINDLGVDTNIEDYLVKLVYYKKNTDETNTISFNELMSFINDVVYNNQDIEISEEQKDEVSKLSYFTNKDSVNKRRKISDLSNILGINKSTIKDLIIYYNSINLDTKINVQNFIDFMMDSAESDPVLSQYINKEELDKLFEAFKGDRLELVVNIAAYYGLRRSEVLGLKWDVIDFDNKTMTIARSVCGVPKRVGKIYKNNIK